MLHTHIGSSQSLADVNLGEIQKNIAAAQQGRYKLMMTH